ncbi:hypothetical protein [Lysobacter capsici]|uniref:hypothetical protein n=1 Tax=Lysobacter capsici TaxID=435897 RepID=UPI00287B7C2C|nr:hypothetical protein [Lysobacter capsici]WND82015.1 hypothetical protein RJ610_06545 [Lysobacter capsici]
MTRELEILPGTTRSLTPASISANLPESTLIVRNAFSETLLDKDSPLSAEIHLLNYEKNYFI